MSLSAGTRLGSYEIVSPIGAGGMGEVYRARDTKLKREVAVKVLPEALAKDTDALARFEREAHAVAALNHPNILSIFDFGSHDGTAYAVTELLEGKTLREELSEGPLSLRRSIDCARQLATGLAAAHEKGIVHRDLKPENIFVTRDGRVKILDFGLARNVLPAPSATNAPTTPVSTAPGTVLGTVGYMSPEQVKGLAADARSDIFSFGTVLYEMLTGLRAFRRDTAAETMTAILREDPPAPAETGKAVPPGLDRILQHCLEKSPESRFQSARDISFSLEAISDRSAVSGLAAASPIRSVRVAVPGLAVAALALAAAGGVLGWLLRPEPPEPPRIRYLTSSGHDSAPSVSPDGRTVAFASDRDGRFRIWLKQLSGGAEVALTTGADNFPRFSPDGATILFTRTEGSHSALYRVAAVGGDARKVIDDANEGDWSPDARQIAFVRAVSPGGRSAMEVDVADFDGSHVRTLVRLEGALLAGPRWSPDGRWVACSRSSFGNVPAVVLLTSADGKTSETVRPPALLGPMTIPAFTGSGSEIVYPQFENAVGIIAGSSSRLWLQRVGSARARMIAWLPGLVGRAEIGGPGIVIADSLSTRGNLREVPVSPATGEERWLTRGNSNDRQPSFSPDGEEIAFSSNRGGNLDVWVMSRRTGSIRPITDDAAEDWDPCFTRDGKGLLWSSNRTGHFEIWETGSDGSGTHPVTHNNGDSENPVVSPDGKWIAYVDYSPARAGIWKCRPDGSESTRLVAGSFQWAEISPDGNYVAATEFTADPSAPVDLRVYRFTDGRPTTFDVRLAVSSTGLAGRDRWLPGGKAIAFLGMDERGSVGIFAQEFDPGRDTTSTRRPLIPFDANVPVETFGVSPDGKSVVVEGQELTTSLLRIDGLPGIAPPQRPKSP